MAALLKSNYSLKDELNELKSVNRAFDSEVQKLKQEVEHEKTMCELKISEALVKEQAKFADRVTEAYKDGQRDALKQLQDMRALFTN